MVNFKKVTAGVSALLLAFSMTACGGSEEEEELEVETAEITTTTAATVAINTETLNEEDQNTIQDVASSALVDQELENKTIKWLAHYDINPTTSGNSKSVALELFESKYGATVQWYPTTWNTRYTDLSTYVLGGEGIDFFPWDTEALPKGIISGMFEPVDDYIDMDNEIWSSVSKYMEIFNYGGKHYEFCTGIDPMNVVIYSKKTIEENGLQDPWEQYQNGEWNWNTFKESLMSFVDPDADCYGLDGWWYEGALAISCGVPAVSNNNGTLELNLYDERLEACMNFAEDLYKNGLCADLSLFDWSERPSYMGEGKELFYIIGAWGIMSDPSVWNTGISPDDIGIVPVPCSPDYDPAYAITPNGFVLCKGAANPEGVARYAECNIVAGMQEEADEIGKQKSKDDYGWTDEIFEMYDACCKAAEEYPAFDTAPGISNDFNTLITSYAIYEPFRGGSYAALRDEVNDAATVLLDEANEQLAAM